MRQAELTTHQNSLSARMLHDMLKPLLTRYISKIQGDA